MNGRNTTWGVFKAYVVFFLEDPVIYHLIAFIAFIGIKEREKERKIDKRKKEREKDRKK